MNSSPLQDRRRRFQSARYAVILRAIDVEVFLKNTILPAICGLLISAFAAQAYCEVLLDCNTSIGPDQQVIVYQDGGQLVLKELTSTGVTLQRALSGAEWSSQKLNLVGHPGEKNTLEKTSDGWAVSAKSPAYNEFGFADCR